MQSLSMKRLPHSAYLRSRRIFLQEDNWIHHFYCSIEGMFTWELVAEVRWRQGHTAGAVTCTEASLLKFANKVYTVVKGCMQHNRGRKANLYVLHSTAQHSTCLLRLTVSGSLTPWDTMVFWSGSLQMPLQWYATCLLQKFLIFSSISGTWIPEMWDLDWCSAA